MSANVLTFDNITITHSAIVQSEVLDINFSGASRPSIDVTTLSTPPPAGGELFGSMKFIPGVHSDPGEMTITRHFNPDDVPKIDSAAGILHLDFYETGGDTVGATWECQEAFITSWETGGEVNGKAIETITFKLSGPITTVDGS